MWPFTHLGHLAAITEHAVLGTAAVVLPLRQPLLAAKAATVDVLSGGRFILGLAGGDRPVECPLFGLEFADRGERFRHGVETLRAAWSTLPPAQGLDLRHLGLTPDRHLTENGHSSAAEREATQVQTGRRQAETPLDVPQATPTLPYEAAWSSTPLLRTLPIPQVLLHDVRMASHGGLELASPVPGSTFLDSLFPALVCIDKPLVDQELDDILDAWPKPLPAYGYVQFVEGALLIIFAVQCFEGRRSAVDLDVRAGVPVLLPLIVKMTEARFQPLVSEDRAIRRVHCQIRVLVIEAQLKRQTHPSARALVVHTQRKCLGLGRVAAGQAVAKSEHWTHLGARSEHGRNTYVLAHCPVKCLL
ncbi:LLM class flavin-dependent oxidoreductase [Streptomyces sp. NPDC005271]|uniref:LLM class flavin-dependent oxidoreductase n=1 Tax=unclassified Streptomyces TaxID=2593676 RepID=UPI0033A4A30E